MTRRLVTALGVLLTSSLAAPNIGHAQTFKVEKFDIKGDGGTDYVAVEAATGRVFVSRASHMMVVEGATGKVLGDIPNTPGVHGAGIVATVELEDTAPEGAAADGKGHIFVNNEGKNTIQVVDVKMWKATASWPLAPCEGPTGIAYDRPSNRIFSGCNKTSVVVNPDTGKVVASIANGTRVDALGWDPSKKLIYIPNGAEGNVTVVHQDSPDKYTVVATVPTFAGAKTITVDPKTHNAYLFQPERGPAPAPPAGAPPPSAAPGGRGRGPQGPIVASWFIVIKQ